MRNYLKKLASGYKKWVVLICGGIILFLGHSDLIILTITFVLVILTIIGMCLNVIDKEKSGNNKSTKV